MEEEEDELQGTWLVLLAQETMLETGARRQTDMGCGALCPPGRTSACSLSSYVALKKEACAFLLLFNQEDGILIL